MRENTAARLASLEGQISGVATQMGDFIREAKDHRDRQEREVSSIWEALKEQGRTMQLAVDRLSQKGVISWPAIISTVAVMMSLIGAAAALGNTLMEARARQHDIRIEHLQTEMERAQKELDEIRHGSKT